MIQFGLNLGIGSMFDTMFDMFDTMLDTIFYTIFYPIFDIIFHFRVGLKLHQIPKKLLYQRINYIEILTECQGHSHIPAPVSSSSELTCQVYNDYYTNKTAFTTPSLSGSFVIWAYFPQTTFPPAVTSPSSETFTSMIVPLVRTPS